MSPAGADVPPSNLLQNTTIAVVATSARLTKAQATKIAQMADDGLARAIKPSHGVGDGDTIFVMATGTDTRDATNLVNGIGARPPIRSRGPWCTRSSRPNRSTSTRAT